MDLKLELVLIPVSDVDRAKAFYVQKAGFTQDVDHQPNDDFRVVQLTPPGSACSITIGKGLSDATPGSVKGTHLVVSDIEAARAELVGRGVDVSEIRHLESGEWVPGPDPERSNYARSPTSAIPTATPGSCRRPRARPGMTDTDQAVAAAIGGDEAAFASITERHRRELHIHCYRMLASFDEAEDAVQETFLRAWRSRESFGGGALFRAWLYRIATNVCLDTLRRNSRRLMTMHSFAEVPWLQPYPDRLLDEVAPGDEEPDAVIARNKPLFPLPTASRAAARGSGIRPSTPARIPAL